VANHVRRDGERDEFGVALGRGLDCPLQPLCRVGTGHRRAEIAVHPAEGEFVQRHAEENLAGIVLYLMCGDVRALVESLVAKGVTCAPLHEENWGLASSLILPSGASVGLYQPVHPTAIG
jgi:hypothetical protein